MSIKKIFAVVAISVVGLTSLTACASSDPEYAAVCVDPNTEERLPDDYCDDDSPNYLGYAVLWYMAMNSSHSYPAVGTRVNKTHFTTKLPKNSKYTTGLSSKGGSSVKSWGSTKFGSSSTSKSGTSSTTKSGSSTSKSGGFSSGSRSTTRR